MKHQKYYLSFLLQMRVRPLHGMGQVLLMGAEAFQNIRRDMHITLHSEWTKTVTNMPHLQKDNLNLN